MIERWRDTAEMIARNWLRCLLSILGATEVLMAAGAAPHLMAVGAVGGLALIAAAWLPASPIGLGALVIIGTAPFAALGWTVPVLLLVAAAVVAARLVQAARRAHGGGVARCT